MIERASFEKERERKMRKRNGWIGNDKEREKERGWNRKEIERQDKEMGESEMIKDERKSKDRKVNIKIGWRNGWIWNDKGWEKEQGSKRKVIKKWIKKYMSV